MNQKEQFKEVEKLNTFGQMKKFITDNLLQVTFVIGLVVWVITSAINSLINLFTLNFDSKLLSLSFIVCIVTGSYLSIQRYLKNRKTKPKKDKTCDKCGKNRKQK